MVVGGGTRWRRTGALLAAAVVVAAAWVVVPAATGATGLGAECAPAGSASLTVGQVDCLRLPSAAVGGEVPVGYYIPPACDPALPEAPRCPVLYYLHGTDGSYQEGVGTSAAPSSWVRALTSGPPVDPRAQPQPWVYADVGTWVPKPSLDMILVSPHGMTIPGGYGPGPNQNPFWFDWNPRYAAGGDSQRYDTPPPRFETFLVDELVPFVDATFPTEGTRAQRAIVGTSMGGIGALANGFRHPDVWSSVGARSGGGAPFGAVDDLLGPFPFDVAPPVELPPVPLPGVVPTIAPAEVWGVMYGSAATVGFGDVAADSEWWRYSQPHENAGNLRAWAADGTQSTHVKFFANDMVPRRVEDLQGDARDVALQIGFEVALYPTNVALDVQLDRLGVEHRFDVGPGTHSGAYSRAYHREQLEQQYANLRHADGGGSPRPDPVVFDYRSVRDDFRIWSWHVMASHASPQFTYLTEVRCDAFTVQGTGSLTVEVPPACGTGDAGQRIVTVDLGPEPPVGEVPAAAVASSPFGLTRTVHLAPLASGLPAMVDDHPTARLCLHTDLSRCDP